MTSGSSAQGSTYAMGYSDEFLQLLKRRNVHAVASHLLPFLKPGLKVLDCGCGPGTISVGLAEAVAPGALYGIDLAASQVAMASAAARAGGHGNAIFQEGDILKLPFEDNTFDVVHCHAVLMHVPQLEKALEQVRRVLKPGGILSAREAIISCNIFTPDDGSLASANKTFARLLEASGGRPNLGKELKGILLGNGFADPQATASFECFDSSADRRFMEGFLQNWFFSGQMKTPAIKYGLATEEEFNHWATALHTWREDPGSFATFGWGEVIARRAS